jgi:hypothetical protein
MQDNQTCACGETVILDKTIAQENELGYWQDCICKSTLLFGHEKWTKLLNNEETGD